MHSNIKVAVVGIGNCANSLVQGIYYYKNQKATEAVGLMHWEIGGYGPGDIEVVAALDIDKRKVGRDVSRAIFAEPNCTQVFEPNIPETGVVVQMGKVLDGFSEHLKVYPERHSFVLSPEPEPDKDQVVEILRSSGADIMLNYLPVGSEEATRFYAQCALDAGLGFVNNIPVFIASETGWAEEFTARNLPLVGDDIKAQLGATIVHRALGHLFKQRGVRLDRTYQLNTGGNTDFLNMLNRDRLQSKKESKSEAVQSVLGNRLDLDNIHIGPSDYVPWQKDNKVCFLRMEGRIFGDVPVNLELRLSVEDSPNSAGVAIDAVRCCKLALDRGQKGPLYGPSAYLMKHPPVQYSDDTAYNLTEDFISKGENQP